MARRELIILFIASVILVALAEKIQLYTDKYDHIDADAILENERLRNQYLNCYLGSGPCLSPDAKFLRDTFPEALATKCKRCTQRQSLFFEKITLYFTEKEPATWNKIVMKAIERSRKKN
ncbi:putative odorant-binding protein A10 [Prorops nasuta]|uniref:putative odorant-binding protein A10 n=1 Tax=Prorops nasuta TaxID=863751 RepID=UPI0034CE7CAA